MRRACGPRGHGRRISKVSTCTPTLRCERGDERRLERLCRYVLRPPLAQHSLSWTAEGKVLLRLRRRWRDGTQAIRFEPSELLERLAAMVPRPRTNLILYHGAFAPRGCRSTAAEIAVRDEARQDGVQAAMASKECTECPSEATPGSGAETVAAAAPEASETNSACPGCPLIGAPCRGIHAPCAGDPQPACSDRGAGPYRLRASSRAAMPTAVLWHLFGAKASWYRSGIVRGRGTTAAGRFGLRRGFGPHASSSLGSTRIACVPFRQLGERSQPRAGTELQPILRRRRIGLPYAAPERVSNSSSIGSFEPGT